MKKVFFFTVVCTLLSNPVFSQTKCRTAVKQLQAYAAQVNQIYYNEYWTYIPNQRCPAIFNGQYVNPTVVQNCRWQMLANLNQWYSQQCNYVNYCYAQIVANCDVDAADEEPAEDVVEGHDENAKIDTGVIKNLTAGVDENKSVKITIPKTAAGFKPN